MAHTRNTWSPGRRSSYAIGVSHASIGPASSWHSNAAPASEASVKDAAMLAVLAGGPDRIVVSGGVVSAAGSTVQV